MVGGWADLADDTCFFTTILPGLLFSNVFVLPFLQIVYPKSDEQRKRLSEAVKPIFIFRSLDPVSISNLVWNGIKTLALTL